MTIDWQGYAVNGVNSSAYSPIGGPQIRYGTAVNGSKVTNATVENLTVTAVRHGVRFRNASNVAVRDVRGISQPSKVGQYIRPDRGLIAVQFASVRNATVWATRRRATTNRSTT